MLLDPATLTDLEIVPSSSRQGTTLWQMLDRTTTEAGRRALRRCLTASSLNAAQILDRQQAHRALVSTPLYRELLHRANLDGVAQYVNATWQLPSHMDRLAWCFRWYHDYLRDVEDGQRRVRALLGAAQELRDRLAASSLVALTTVGEHIDAILQHEPIRDLERLSNVDSPAGQRRFDQMAREHAKPSLLALIACLASLEASWSLGMATAEHGWAYPTPGSRLIITGLCHPFLGSAAIPNDVDLAEAVRVCFVTGPNMAGKSTFLKAIAIATYLAHLGCGVPATAMTFPVVATIFSSVDILDDLKSGESFYLAEVRRIRALGLALREHGPCVAVIDEPFRGTNVHDAAEATLAIMSRLAAVPLGLVFVASHIGEVVAAIENDARILPLRFSAVIENDRPVFDYRLRVGVSNQRLGMTLLAQEGVLELLEQVGAAPNRQSAG